MAKARRLAEERRAAEEAAAAAAAEAALAEAPKPAGRTRKPRRGVFYSAIYPSVELGPIHLASNGVNLVGVWLPKKDWFSDTPPRKVLADNSLRVFLQTKDWLERYFAGERPAIAELPLALDDTDFRQRVWLKVITIPYGQVRTYGQIARELAAEDGKDKMATSAVSAAVAHNPLSIIIPCHRVVGAGGKLGSYPGGIENKIRLLEHEGVDLSAFDLTAKDEPIEEEAAVAEEEAAAEAASPKTESTGETVAGAVAAEGAPSGEGLEAKEAGGEGAPSEAKAAEGSDAPKGPEAADAAEAAEGQDVPAEEPQVEADAQAEDAPKAKGPKKAKAKRAPAKGDEDLAADTADAAPDEGSSDAAPVAEAAGDPSQEAAQARVGQALAKRPWLEAYLLAKAGCAKDWKAEWEWWRYQVGGKLFAAAMVPGPDRAPEYAERPLLSLKCDPVWSERLRADHEGVLPGFYADKRCWISVDLGSDVPDDLLRELIDHSYDLVFSKLTKKAQREIAEG